MSDLSTIPLTFASVRQARRRGALASDLVAEACRRAQEAAEEGVFTALVPPVDAVDRARGLQRRADRGEHLPLLGIAFAVKDNIHVAGMATTPLVLAAALFVAGASDAITDVAQNAHALRVQRNYGRSIINSFHAVWAVGAIVGGLMGAAAIALHISRTTHLTIAAVIFVAVVVIAYPYLLDGADHEDHPSAHTSGEGGAGMAVYATLLALVVISIAGATVEDAGSSWATLYLRDSLGAPGPVAAFGYVALVGFMFVGRLAGDRLVDRFGERAVVRTGGFIAAAGMGCALAFPSVPGTIAGFAAAGLGVATLIPAAMHGADQLPGMRPGTGLTAVTWLMRVGFFGAPLIVGVVADATSLRVGLLSVPIAGLMAVALARALSARRRPSRS